SLPLKSRLVGSERRCTAGRPSLAMLSPEAQQLAAGSPEILTELPNDLQMRRLKKELISGARARQELTILESHRIAEANRQFEGRVWNGGAGIRRVGRYPLKMHLEFMGRYGEDCWRDPAFLEDTLAKNPWMRIEQHKRIQIMVDGFKGRGDRHKDTDGNRAAGSPVPAGN